MHSQLLEDLSHLPMINYLQSCPYPKRTNALLSIRPEYVARIIDGSKAFEFRRTMFARQIDVVVIYATAPVGRVVAEFDIVDILKMSPKRLWEATRHAAGIGRRIFFDYFKGKTQGYAIQIGEVRAYEQPLCIREHLGMRPPQSYAYLHSGWPLTARYCD